jgi:hypothetical protein
MYSNPNGTLQIKRYPVKKKITLIGLALALMLIFLPSCSRGTEEPSAPRGKYEILRKAILEGKWQMYQLKLELPLNGEFDIDFIDLAEGDRVDGYFYPGKGTGISLEIRAGTAVVYRSEQSTGDTDSARFSFSASQPAGTAYVLLFKNVGTDKEIVVLVELIYPVTARIRGPLDLK